MISPAIFYRYKSLIRPKTGSGCYISPGATPSSFSILYRMLKDYVASWMINYYFPIDNHFPIDEAS